MSSAYPTPLDVRPNRPAIVRLTRSDAGDPVTLPEITRNSFTDAMSRAATGVNIVTTDGPGGRFGLTVSAFASVSANPPSLLICINDRSPMSRAIQRNRHFCVNVLACGQDALAQTFAGQPRAGAAYDFNQDEWRIGATGVPALSRATANFECTLDQTVAAGSHRIFFGRCAAVKCRRAPPLIYTNRTYGRVCHGH